MNCCCVGRVSVPVVLLLDFDPPQAAASTGTRSNGRARRTRAERSEESVERVLGESGKDLDQLRPTSLALLREDEGLVDEDVELAALTTDHLCAVLGPVDL